LIVAAAITVVFYLMLDFSYTSEREADLKSLTAALHPEMAKAKEGQARAEAAVKATNAATNTQADSLSRNGGTSSPPAPEKNRCRKMLGTAERTAMLGNNETSA